MLVSGGSRGIGAAIARGFAERGARVVVTGRAEKPLEEAATRIGAEAGAPGAVTPVVCDVADPDSVRALPRTVIGEFGRVDVLFNVAGVNRRRPALEMADEDFDFVVDINLRGAFLLSREVGRHMVERGSGCQVNIASLNTDRPLTNVLAYAVSKAGLAHMTRSLALEWGPHGVRVNALAPGFILTDLTRPLWEDASMRDWAMAATPQRRFGVPDDMIGTAVFLASPAAGFLTGQVIYVDGGFTAGWNWPIPDAAVRPGP